MTVHVLIPVCFYSTSCPNAVSCWLNYVWYKYVSDI